MTLTNNIQNFNSKTFDKNISLNFNNTINEDKTKKTSKDIEKMVKREKEEYEGFKVISFFCDF